MIIEQLTDENFIIYCAKYYNNPQCSSTEEFIEDLQRIKYIKKLITRYIENGDLKERLILNHLTVLYNIFGPEHTSRILYLKLKDHFQYIKPFLILLNILPDKLINVNNEKVIDLNMIPIDNHIVTKLRELNNDGCC